MGADLSGEVLSSDTVSRVPEAATLSVAVQRRLLVLLREFTDAMAIIEKVVTALETVTGPPAEQPELAPPPFLGTSDPAVPATEVTLDVAMDDPAFLAQLQEALAEFPSVERIRLAEAGDRSARLAVTLAASPTPMESLLTFRDTLAETRGVGRVLLTEFVDDHATFLVALESASAEFTATEAPSVVCAWCGRLLTVGGSLISHGICPACAARTAAGVSGTEDPPAASPTTDAVVYLQRSADIWLERRYGQHGEWVTNPTSYSADLPAQTVFEGVSMRYPDRLVVLAGRGEPVGVTPATPGAAARHSPPLRLQRQIRSRQYRGEAHVSLKRLRQTLSMAVPVDPELLLEALASVQTIVDGVAHGHDLDAAAALELGRGLTQLQETIDLIGRMAAGSAPARSRRPGTRARSRFPRGSES